MLVQFFTIWHNSCVPDERAGNGGQERKPRSEEKRRRRERTRGEGDSTGLRHQNERLQRRNERLRRENDRLKRKIDHLEKQLATARRAGFRQAAPFAKNRPQGRGGHPGRRAGAAYQPVAKVDDCGSTRSVEFRTLDSHGDGQKTGGSTSVADVGGHGGPSDE